MHRSATQAIVSGKTPVAARNWKKAMRGFLDRCLSLDMIKVDPLAGVTKAKMNKTNGHHPGNRRSSIRSGRGRGWLDSPRSTGPVPHETCSTCLARSPTWAPASNHCAIPGPIRPRRMAG